MADVEKALDILATIAQLDRDLAALRRRNEELEANLKLQTAEACAEVLRRCRPVVQDAWVKETPYYPSGLLSELGAALAAYRRGSRSGSDDE